MRLSIPPNTIPPSLGDVQDAIGRLRAEADQAEPLEQKAALLFELGVLQELGRDDHGAAKDLLGAINAGNLLREPIERLIFLIERRRSYKNLGKLLDRLGRVANSAEEIVRAQLSRGEFLTDYKADFAAAREAYELALTAAPQDPNLWLSVQVFAAKAEDSELMARALGARSEAAKDSRYRALLRLLLARFQARAGQDEAAQRTLEESIREGGEFRFSALLELLNLARRKDDEVLVASCLESQAELITAALSDAHLASASGIPADRLTRASAADAWLRAALSHKAFGNDARATQLMQSAQQLLPGNVSVAYSYMLMLEAAGETLLAVDVAKQILEEGNHEGSAQAALLLRVANANLVDGQVKDALTALKQCLEMDPRNVPARALQLNLLQQTEHATELALAVEAIAHALPGGVSKARSWLLAAFLWSHGVRDSALAKSALRAAASSGLDALTLTRAARTFAALTHDAAWEAESVAQWIKLLPEGENAGARLELARSSWLSGNVQLTREQLSALSNSAETSWAAYVLFAYGGLAGGDRELALLKLAEQQATSEVGAALRLLVAYRAHLAGRVEPAVKALKAVQEEQPADPVSGLLRASGLLKAGQPHQAAEALGITADATEHLDVAHAFLLQAGLLHWRNNEREAAVRCFERAQQLSPAVATALLSWALRSARPDVPEARRRALSTAQESEAEADLGVLERFALEVGLTQHRADATAALDEADEVGLGDVGDAVQLTRALWTEAAGHSDALSSLDRRSPAGLRVARALSFARKLQDRSVSAEQLAEVALEWAETQSLPALLEALSAVQAAGRAQDEVPVRKAIAEHLTGEAKEALIASAALVQLLIGDAPAEPLQGSSPQVRLMNGELAYPGSDPRIRATALSELGALAGEETQNLNLLLIGVNQLASGDHEAALSSFQSAKELFPDDLTVHMGLRDAAASLGDKPVEAEACFRVAQLSHDSATAAAQFRRAAELWCDELQQSERGYEALSQAVACDIQHTESFQRLFRYLRDQQEHQRVLDLSSARLEVAQDISEITKLYWERARANRALNRTSEALLELSNVRLLDAGHLGSMALSAEIHLTRGQYSDAAKQLADLAAYHDAPSEQRLMSGMAAVDLYETKLGDLSSALSVLAILKEARLSTLPVRERLARAAAKAGRWEDAANLLVELMRERETREGRIEAARLALAIYRDRLDDPARALAPCRCLLQEAPSDAEAIDLVLDEVFDEQPSTELLLQARAALVASCGSEVNSEQVARLARVAEYLEDLPLRQGCLGALVTLGINSDDLRSELRALDARAPHHPQMAISEEMADHLLLPEAKGPVAELLRQLAPSLSSVIGPSLKSLQVGRKQRVKPQSGSELRDEIAHWAGAFGLADFDLYVGLADPEGVICIADPRLPAFVVGENIRPPFGPELRQSLAMRVFALSRGLTVLLERERGDVAALIVAACRVCGIELNAPPYALAGEFYRLLSRELPRKLKKEMVDNARAVAAAEPDLLAWAEAALTSLQTIAALAVGDVSWVLLSPEERLTRERNIDAHTEAQRGRVLMAALSEEFRELREQLGMAVK